MPSSASIEMIKKLVAFDTTSRNSNLALMQFIQDYLKDLDINSTLIKDKSEEKANLYATVGPKDVSGIMLSGHTDVVPVDGQNWDTEPFEAIEKNNKIFGRGTCDMKSFIAVVLAMLPQFINRGLKIPLHLAFSFDEEVGCIGVRSLINFINQLPLKPRMAIVGEPTSMEVVAGHKGKRSYRACVSGFEAHSSLAPKGVNAIEYAARFITFLNNIGQRIAENGPFDPLYDIKYTTLHVGTIEGGTALNIVPKECFFDFEMRYIGDENPDQIQSEFMSYSEKTLDPLMKAVNKESGFIVELVNDVPGLDISEDHEAVSFVKALAERNNVKKVAFGTEAGLFQTRSKIPAVICGPGSIEQAHKPNEFISLEQIDKAEKFMTRLIDQLC